MERVLPRTTFTFTVDADVEVFEPMKEGPGARTYTISKRRGETLSAYLVRETPQHYFIKLDDGGVAFLHKISVART